jgi:hypothetical protein
MPNWKDKVGEGLALGLIALGGPHAVDGYITRKQELRERGRAERERKRAGIVGVTQSLLGSGALDDAGQRSLLKVLNDALGDEKGLERAQMELSDLLLSGYQVPGLEVGGGAEPGGPLRIDAGSVEAVRRLNPGVFNLPDIPGAAPQTVEAAQPGGRMAPLEAGAYEPFTPLTREAVAGSYRPRRDVNRPFDLPDIDLPPPVGGRDVPVRTEFESPGDAPRVKVGQVRKPLLLPRDEVSRRKIAEKVAEIKATDEARYPGWRRQTEEEYEFKGKLKDKEIAARVAESGRKFGEWLQKQDIRERAAIQKKRKELADSFFTSGRAQTMPEALAMAGEMISEGASLDVDLKGSRLKLNEEQLPLIRRKVAESQARTARLIQEMNSGIPASAKRAYDVEVGDLRARLRGIQQERAAIQRRLSEGKALPGDYQATLDALDDEEETLTTEVRAARDKALGGGSSASPKGRALAPPRRPGEWGEDPAVRAFAEQFFGGDYGKAQMEIERQQKAKGKR